MGISSGTTVCLFMATFAAILSQGEAAKKVPPAKPASGPFSFFKCPSSPLQYCDFYWQGYRNAIPTFKVNKISKDTIIYKGYLHSGKTFQPVYSASSFGQCYFVPEYRAKDPKCGTAFYFKGRTSPLNSNLLAERTVVNTRLKEFSTAKCVVLPVGSAKIRTSPKVGKKPATYMYINSNDGNAQYPQNRRCVVFRAKLG